MNMLNFVSAVIDSIAWPVTTLIALLILRTPLVRILGAIKTMKVGGAELAFQDMLAEVEVAAKNSIAPGYQVAVDQSDQSLDVAQRYESPRDAVLENWILLWHDVANAVRLKNPEMTQNELRNSIRLIDASEQTGVLNAAQANLLRELRNLRNMAAHAPHFSLGNDDAERYVATAASLRNVVQSKR